MHSFILGTLVILAHFGHLNLHTCALPLGWGLAPDLWTGYLRHTILEFLPALVAEGGLRQILSAAFGAEFLLGLFLCGMAAPGAEFGIGS